MRIFARGSPGVCHSGIGAGCDSVVDALLDEDAHERAAEALAHRPLSSGVVGVMPSPYRSAMMPPFQVTTKAAVSAGGVECGVHRLPAPWPCRCPREVVCRQHVAHRPRLGLRIGQRALHDRRGEEHIDLADRAA